MSASSNGNGRLSSYAPRENHAAASRIARQPGAKDGQQGQWPRSKLLRMDLRFRQRMERAIERGLERRPDGENPVPPA